MQNFKVRTAICITKVRLVPIFYPEIIYIYIYMYVCISSICYIIELYPVGMYQDYLAYVLLSVGGRNSIWIAKYLAQDLNYGLSY